MYMPVSEKKNTTNLPKKIKNKTSHKYSNYYTKNENKNGFIKWH